MYEFEGVRRIIYSNDAVFVPVCSYCGRFVKADSSILISERGLVDQPNATCSKCGRIKMLFEGFYTLGEDE